MPSPAATGRIMLTYGVFVMSNTVLLALLPRIEHDLSFSSGQAAAVASLTTLAQGSSKLLYAGWPADVWGGRRTIATFVTVMALCTITATLAHTAAGVGAAMFALEFVSTPVWPAHVQLVRGWFPDPSAGLFALGLASRTAVIASKVTWGALEGVWPWRRIAVVGAALGVAGAGVAAVFHRNVDPSRTDVALPPPWSCNHMWRVTRRLVREPQMWLATAATTAVVVIKRSNEMLLPVYFADTAADVLTDGQASMVSVVWSAGLIVSVLVGAAVFRWVQSPARRVAAVDGMLLVSAAAAAVLALWSAPVTTTAGVVARGALVVTAACGIGVCMYVPPGMFAVQYGKENAGVVSVWIDGVAYLSSAAFMRGLKPVINSSLGWGGVWAIVAGLAVLALVLEHWFVRAVLTADAAFTKLPHTAVRHGVPGRWGLQLASRCPPGDSSSGSELPSDDGGAANDDEWGGGATHGAVGDGGSDAKDDGSDTDASLAEPYNDAEALLPPTVLQTNVEPLWVAPQPSGGSP